MKQQKLMQTQNKNTKCHHINPFWSYVGPRPTWFSCSRRFSWSLTLSNPIFLPPAYSPALIYFGRERGWWVTCNYPTVLKEKNRKSTTCVICWLKSVINHNVGRSPTLWFPCSRHFSSYSSDFSQQIAQVTSTLHKIPGLQERNNANITATSVHVSSFQPTAGRRPKDEITFYFISRVI
jgi:hypothetical protein